MSGHEKTRAVVLTAIMVISVFGMGFAFAGGAAASDIDRNDSASGTVDQGADNVEVLDFSLTSEDQVLDSDRVNTGDDGDVEPGDELESLDPGNYSYVDDNGNQQYEADETLLYDGNGTAVADDEFNNQDEVIQYTDGAFRPYQFGGNKFFVDVNDDTGDRGTYTGEDFSDDGNVSREAILNIEGDEEIDGDTNVLTTGQANVTEFNTSGVEDTLSIYDQDNNENGDVYEPEDNDFIFINGNDDVDYEQSEDTILVGDDPGGDVSANVYEVEGTELNDELAYLDFSQNGEYDFTEDDGGEPVVFTDDNDLDTGDALPNDAEFLAPSEDIAENYYEQYDEESGTFEEGADDDDGDAEVDDTGLQGLDTSDTLFLDDGGPDQSYSGEDGEDEDVVDNDLQDANVLVDGEQDNFKGEDIGPNADDDGTPSENFEDAVIRGQNDQGDAGGFFGAYETGLNLYTEPDGDNFEELVLVNEVDDDVNEDSSVDAPGPEESGADDEDTVYYGDAMVDLTVTNTGSAENNEDIAGATLYRETDGESGLTSGDTLVKASTFEQNDLVFGAPGQYLFDNLDQVYGNGTTGDSARFYVGADVQGNADEGDTLQFAIPQFRDGQTAYRFDSQTIVGSSSTASDTGLFLESEEAFSTGPVTNINGEVYRQDYYEGSGGGQDRDTGPGPIVTGQTVTIGAEGGSGGGDSGDNEHTLQITGTDDYTPYWLRVPGQITDTTDITSEDDVSSDSASGAVGPGSDSYTFTGDPADLQLYVPTGATVEIDGTQVNPDNYESQVSFVGDGDYSSYNFEVKNGQITGSSGLTDEDNIDQSDDSASGAVASGSDSYTFTGSFEGVDIDGGADLTINGEDADLSAFYNTLRFEGQGSYATYDFTVSGEIENTAGVTGEDSVSENGADGAIKGGSDVYVYSGTLDSLNTDGNVVVEDENGDEVSDT